MYLILVDPKFRLTYVPDAYQNQISGRDNMNSFWLLKKALDFKLTNRAPNTNSKGYTWIYSAIHPVQKRASFSKNSQLLQTPHQFLLQALAA